VAYNYARRAELAREAGFSSYSAMRRASSSERAAARIEAGQTYGLTRQVGVERHVAAVRAEAGDAVTRTPDGEQVSAHYMATVTAAARRAATADRYLGAIVTVRTSDRELIDVEIWSKGGILAATFLGQIADHGGTRAALLWNVEHAVAGANFGRSVGIEVAGIEHVDLTVFE
jgi:hypothetical protein